MRCLLAVLLSMSTVSDALSEENPASISLVKTWEELQALPPIDLGDSVKIRLGLEADKIPQWSGALLYCLTEGYLPPSSESGPMSLGPVRAEFAFENKRYAADQVSWADDSNMSSGTYLYLRALPIDRVGSYHVTVTDRQGEVLAKGQVEGTKDFFHPWMPWIQSFKKPVSPPEGIALPHIDSKRPADFIELGKAKQGQLPTFLPSGDMPSLTIKMEGNVIVIRAESEFTTSWPNHHFLARWWVNDKPFVPKQTEQRWLFDRSGRILEAKELRLAFEFHPECLGAKPGDKISLQLMHSECGWDWCVGSLLANHGGRLRKPGENVRVSNQIEFDVPDEGLDNQGE
jgi:hypothetical protein